MKHKFVHRGGYVENPGIWDNGHGGLVYVASCACGIVRKRGVDYTGARPDNNWGPHYYNSKGERISRAGSCERKP